MKSFIVFALFVAAAVAVPVDREEYIVNQQQYDNAGDSQFKNSFETSNLIKSQAEGKLVDVGTPEEGLAVRGQFSYVGPDGITYAVDYTADKFGFHPKGDHIPQAS